MNGERIWENDLQISQLEEREYNPSLVTTGDKIAVFWQVINGNQNDIKSQLVSENGTLLIIY